ncbi:uncharacterized protein LOC119720051 isoform X2 [Patiria miniata]|uniref:Sushi, nidogen and EGF-like domain-containing protein 1 n=1 Tax=Patiria miniata TaxID=46514 RepID=A0A913Z1E6_PATMI|nr:uncharacterized protein LOC119720051 isoform X2 [Patiria miniata]
MDCSSPHEILFPFAEPDAVYLASTDEGTSVEIPLPFNMAVFDQNHGSLYVNINGSISFDGAQIPFVNIPQSGNKHLILPFFSNITTERVGFVTYRHFLRTPENERLFCEADEIVGDVFSGQSNFSASFMLIATWYKVPSKTPGPTRNTFQAVLVTDGTRSFAMFNYEDIQWSYAQRDQVGFDAGDGVNFYLISEARTADIVNIDERSNIGIRGRWLFRIDQSSVELPTMNTTACEIATTCHIPDGAQCEGDGNPQGCTCSGSPQQCSCSLGFFGLDCSKILFPFGLRDDIVNNGDFDSSGEIPIPVEFPFFGRYFNSIFVNIKGLLSFTNKITSITPLRFPLANGIPSIAVYWADAITADFYHGSVQYRYFFRNTTTRNAMLFRHADEIIRRVFTSQSEFSASWMMVATWHKYNTFQGVLVTDGAQSFAIHNYQKIIWTTGQFHAGDNFGLGGIPALVGFHGGDGINYYEVPGSQSNDIVNMDQRSNINTIGRWIFRIDLPEIQGPVVMSCPSAIVHNGNTFWNPLSVMAFNLTDSSTVSASCNIRHLRGGRDTIVTSDYLLPSYAARITCYAPSTSPVATCRFDVTFDNVAPVFQSCQSQVVYATPGTNQSIVVLDPDLFSAIDAVGGPVSVSCSFLNEDSVRVSVGLNSTFPLGMMTVDCEASDAAGNTAFCQLNVTVLESPPPTTEQMPTTGPKDSTTYDTTNGQILTSETTEIKTPVTAVTMSPATDDQTPATAATESLSTDDQTAASDTTVALSTDDQSPATAATVDPSTDDQTPTSDATECPSDDQTPAIAAPMSPSTDDQTPATAAPMSPSTDDQTPATAAPMSPSTDDQTPATAAPMSPSTDDQTPATAAPMSSSTDDQTPATAAPMSPSTDDQTPATAAPMSPSTDDQTPATAAPMSPSTDDQTPATAAPMSPSTDDQTPVTAAPMSPSTDDQTPASAAPMSPSTDDQTPATAAPMSPSTDDQTPATAAPMSPSTDDQTPATAAPMSPSTDDQTPATAAPMSPSTDDQTPATAAPMSPSTDDQTPATAAPMSPSTDDQTPVTAAPMSPSTDDQTPATAAPMSPSTDDQTPATAAPMSLSTDNQTPATTTPMSQSTDAQTHDGTSEYPSGYQTTATDSPTPVCELTESSCQQGTFDEDHCECVCPVSISGRTCQVPNPCLDPTLCPGEEEYCVANIFNPVGYDCVCDALLGYLTEDGGSCTRYIARVFRLRVLGINGIAVDFLPAFGNPTSSASSEALGIIRGVLLFILKRNPLTSAVRDVTDISILSGGSIIVEFVALYNNTDTALVVPSVQIIQSVLQTQSRLEGESDYLAVDTQYVTTEQTTSTCPMNYCANGGTCDIVGLYPMFTLTCRCSTSFTGEHCDSVIPLMGVVPTAPRTDAPTEPPGEGVLPTILIIVIMIVVFVLALLILGFLCIMMRRRIILNRIPIAFKSPDRPSTGRGPDFSRRVWRAEDDANIAVFAPAWQRHLGTRFPARAVNGVRSVPQLQQIPPERSSDFMTPYMVPDFVEMPLHENQGRPMEHSKGQYWPNPAYSGQY